MDEHEKEVENFGRFKQMMIDIDHDLDHYYDFDEEEYNQWLDEVDQKFLDDQEQHETYEEEQDNDEHY